MTTKTCFISLSVFSLFTLFYNKVQAANTPQPVESIDIRKYQGEWYEIVRLPMYFQRNCARDVKANYQLNPDKTLQVINQCHNEKGKINVSVGEAYGDNVGNSQLKVSFLPKGLRWMPFTKGDYWVLRIDPDYQVALIGSPNHKYLWVLSRSPVLDEATLQSYLQTAKEQGYDLSKLIRTQHTQHQSP